MKVGAGLQRLVEIRGVELAVARHAEERQADPYLLLEDLERTLEPGLPRRGQAQAPREKYIRLVATDPTAPS